MSNQNLLISKYNQLSEINSNLQENLLNNSKHLQEQLNVTLDENRSLVRNLSTIEQLHPANSFLNSPLDLRLRALEEQIRPVSATIKSPLDLRLHSLESKPPDVVYDLVNF